jgi:hypothetical protein
MVLSVPPVESLTLLRIGWPYDAELSFGKLMGTVLKELYLLLT